MNKNVTYTVFCWIVKWGQTTMVIHLKNNPRIKI